MKDKVVNPKYRIKDLMDRLGKTPADVASNCGVDSLTVRNWRNIEQDSTKSISADNLRSMAKYFGVTMEIMYSVNVNVPEMESVE